MEFGLTSESWEKIIHLFSSLPRVNQAILYGSRAMGNFREGSDIDITLMVDDLTHEDLKNFIGAMNDLNLPWLFDISIYHEIDNPDLIDHIRRVGKVLYSSTD